MIFSTKHIQDIVEFQKIKNLKKKFLLDEIKKSFDISGKCYICERSHRGHFMYKLEKDNYTAEVVPINIVKKMGKNDYQKIHKIKLESFLQNRLMLDVTLTTEKLYDYYKNLN